ncbi:MAG: M23 family metallopeptidase, partial [Trueperaceae bacterium]|nr:M23 family metallopeptidase [Trueperaceae bacterium]
LESGGKGILALGYRKSNGELQLEHVEQYEAVGGSRSFSESLDMFIVPEEMQILYALFFANGSATSDLSFACEPQIDRVESAPPEPGPSRLWTVDIYGENFTKTQFLRADGSVASVPNVHLISPEGRRFTKDSAENYQVIYESSKHVRVLSPIDISGQWNLEFYYHDGKSVKALIDNFVVSDEVIPFSTGFELPVRPVENEAWVIKGFYGGPNPTSYSGVQHLGEDWNWRSGNQDCGKSIYASSNGKVVLAEYRGAWGGVVVLRHNIRSTGSLFETIYAHMAPADGIAVGSFVERGDLVGTLYDYDGSGPSVCHLHFEARDESIQRKSNTAGWWGSTSGTGYYTATGDNPWPPQGFHEPSEWIRNHSP